MSDAISSKVPLQHSHSFLGAGHDRSERKAWAVIWLCGAMMIAEIIGGMLFGSIALVADGMHMSTHAGALLLAALAYTYARKHADDPRFTFGTGKFGDLAGFTSAIILAMIAVLIGYESISRILNPVPIHFAEAIPIACLGLAVNVASAWLLSGGDHHHAHGLAEEGHDHGESRRFTTQGGVIILEIFEDGVPPRFRLRRGKRGVACCTLKCHRDHAARGNKPAIQDDRSRGLSGISRGNPGASLIRSACTHRKRTSILSSLRNTNTHTGEHSATTTCGLQWFM